WGRLGYSGAGRSRCIGCSWRPDRPALPTRSPLRSDHPPRDGEGEAWLLVLSELSFQIGQASGLILGDQRVEQRGQVAFQNLRQAVQGQADAVIGHAPLREVVGANALGPVARADLRLARVGPSGVLGLAL